MQQVTLGNHTLCPGSRPYVIAEIGVNHEGDLDLAKKLIDLAKEGGADAAKFQSYKACRIASKYSPDYWDTSKEPTPSQYQLFTKFDKFGPEKYQALAEYCLQMDIDMAVETLRQAGYQNLVLLHYILNYPNGNTHLDMIEGLTRTYPEIVLGYSDHTLPDERILVLSAAWLCWKSNFTHVKSLPSNDHYHVIDIHDLKRLVENVTLLEEVLGAESHRAPLVTEALAFEHLRRSIVIDRALPASHVITEGDIIYKRPAHGVIPMDWAEVIARKTARALEEDHVLQWSDLGSAPVCNSAGALVIHQNSSIPSAGRSET